MMKQIMKRAWEIYRTLEGDKVAKLSMALRQAWAEAKAPKKQYSTSELCKLSKMRAAARERAFAADADLRAAYDEYMANRVSVKVAQPSFVDGADGRFTFNCHECGNVFKAFGRYAKCPCCGEDTDGMSHVA